MFLGIMETSNCCENSIQTLGRWLGSLLSAFALVAFVAIAIYGTVWLAVNMVAAVFVMAAGIIQSIRPLDDKRCSRPPVSRFTLFLCFFLLAVPIAEVFEQLQDAGAIPVLLRLP